MINYIYIICIVCVVCMLVYILFTNKNKCNERVHLYNIIRGLVRQTARWSTASIQDKSPLIALLHANYGTGYLSALRDIATSEQIKNATGVDIIKFSKHIIGIQDTATKKVIKICPMFGKQKKYIFSKNSWRRIKYYLKFINK